MTARLLNIRGLMEYTSMGRDKARAFGRAAGAEIRQGRLIIYDRDAIDRYIDSLERGQK